MLRLLEESKDLKWIRTVQPGRVSINYNLPQSVLKKLKDLQTTDRICQLLEKLLSKNLIHHIDVETIMGLLAKGGPTKVVAQIEKDLGDRAMKAGELELARRLFCQLVDRLRDTCQDKEDGALFIDTTLKLSNLCFALGRDFKDIESSLKVAQRVASWLDDQLSLALISLHLGQLFYFSDRRAQALSALSSGMEYIRDLGDQNTLLETAQFSGLYYFMQGRYNEALEHLQNVDQSLAMCEDHGMSNRMGLLYIPYCAAYLGEFRRAIGNLDSYLNSAGPCLNRGMAATLRAALGIFLVQMCRNREALVHLTAAEKEAQTARSDFALWLSRLGLSLHNFREGKPDRAYEQMKQAMCSAKMSGIVHQYGSPFVLEMIHEFHRLGFPPVPGLSKRETMDRIWHGHNNHLRGVALRLRAEEMAEAGADPDFIRADLVASEEYLQQSGDPVQLGKTRLVMIRSNLREKNIEKARKLARIVWQDLGDDNKDVFPQDLRYLLGRPEDTNQARDSRREFCMRYFAEISSLFPIGTQQEIISRAIRIMNRLCKAERGGLFWFRLKRTGWEPELVAGINISTNEVESESFRSTLATVRKSFKENQSITFCQKGFPQSHPGHTDKAVLCVPIEIGGKLRAVLCHTNSFLNDSFDWLDLDLMKEMARHMSFVIDRTIEYQRIKRERDMLACEKSLFVESPGQGGFVAQSALMIELLDQADRVAISDSSILIMGETGVGKEILARRIRQKSARSEGPFVVIDCTSIPKDLIESELFGHEKGAFTGAERRKIGRIEVAHKGTVFFDEIGELPLHAQAKCLRTFQEKTVVRVGGLQEIYVDFRLIAASNRDLWEEKTVGRFREDLYYRLAVIRLVVPPLRARGKDVVLLARYFLEKYSRKYRKSELRFSDGEETDILSYSWPGNVRELKNVIERAVILAQDGRLKLDLTQKAVPSPVPNFDGRPTLNEVQFQYIKHVLEETEGRIAGRGGAAEILGMKRSTLYKRMKNLGMR